MDTVIRASALRLEMHASAFVDVLNRQHRTMVDTAHLLGLQFVRDASADPLLFEDGSAYDSSDPACAEPHISALFGAPVWQALDVMAAANAAVAASIGDDEASMAPYTSVSRVDGRIMQTGTAGVAAVAASQAARCLLGNIMRVSLLADGSDDPAVAAAGWGRNEHVPLEDNARLEAHVPPLDAAQLTRLLHAVDACNDWLDAADEHEVLIHCSQGQSRSTTFAALLIMSRALAHAATLDALPSSSDDLLGNTLRQLSQRRRIAKPAERHLPLLVSYAEVLTGLHRARLTPQGPAPPPTPIPAGGDAAANSSGDDERRKRLLALQIVVQAAIDSSVPCWMQCGGGGGGPYVATSVPSLLAMRCIIDASQYRSVVGHCRNATKLCKLLMHIEEIVSAVKHQETLNTDWAAASSLTAYLDTLKTMLAQELV